MQLAPVSVPGPPDSRPRGAQPVESARHVPVGSGAPLVVLHLPVTVSQRGVVVCSSLFSEVGANQRGELLLARHLAASGFPVVRLQPRGIGSAIDGEDQVPTLGSLVEDTEAASALLREHGYRDLIYVGFRLGAIVASQAAARDQSAHLVLWDPVTSGATYVREALRAGHIAETRDVNRVGTSRADESGREFLGYLISPATERSLVNATVERQLLSPRKILITATERRGVLNRSTGELAADWRAAGHEVTTELMQEQRAWWFVREEVEPPEESASTRLAVDLIAEWICTTAQNPRAAR
jgi:pimeloyl-ACP methyl ester carboxylesterase